MSQTYIYFIQYGESGPIKIGRTDRPIERRIAAFQTASPAPLRLLYLAAEESGFYESTLHYKFDLYRIRGEWFFPVRSILEYIESLQTLNPLPFVSFRDEQIVWPKIGSPIDSRSRSVPKWKTRKVQLSIELTRQELDEIRVLYHGSKMVEMEQLAALIRLGMKGRRQEKEIEDIVRTICDQMEKEEAEGHESTNP